MTFASATQFHSSVINVKALVSAFNQNKVPVEDFSVITNLHVDLRFVRSSSGDRMEEWGDKDRVLA